jgi:hypothetical protein
MRFILFKFSASLIGSVLLVSGCSTEPQYEDRTEEVSKVLKNSVEVLIDNGYIISGEEILVPFEVSQDGFYFVDSPELLDSVFRSINYPSPESPRLDTLFPEGGSLLVLDHKLFFSEELLDHTISFSDDTVRVSLSIRRWIDRPYEPGIWDLVFPMGIVFMTPDNR